MAVLRGACTRPRALVCFLGGIVDKDELTVTRTLRTVTFWCLLASSIARASEASRPDKWPWADSFIKALGKLRLSISLLAERPSRIGAAADAYLCADNQAEQDSLVDYAPTPVDRHPTRPSAATALSRLSSRG